MTGVTPCPTGHSITTYYRYVRTPVEKALKTLQTIADALVPSEPPAGHADPSHIDRGLIIRTTLRIRIKIYWNEPVYPGHYYGWGLDGCMLSALSAVTRAIAWP